MYLKSANCETGCLFYEILYSFNKQCFFKEIITTNNLFDFKKTTCTITNSYYPSKTKLSAHGLTLVSYCTVPHRSRLVVLTVITLLGCLPAGTVLLLKLRFQQFREAEQHQGATVTEDTEGGLKLFVSKRG